MEIRNNYTNTLFKSKCPQVRDAEWVCRTINHTLPHTSTTKHQTRILNFLKNNRNTIKYDRTPQNITEIYKILINNENYEKNQSISKKIESIKNFIKSLGEKRLEAEEHIGFNKLYESLYLTEILKAGNCLENAVIAELILKMNDIHNACCVAIHKGLKNMGQKSWTNLDHAVCIFNRDGSIFNEKINKNTIIIDPWIGKAGFAKDMERYYRNEFSHFYKLDADEVFKYERMEIVDIPSLALEKLKQKYHPFLFKNKNRKFMQR